MYALWPWARTSSAVPSAPASSLCQVMPTSRPCWAKATAVARPIPESAAVTMAYFGVKVMSTLIPQHTDTRPDAHRNTHP